MATMLINIKKACLALIITSFLVGCSHQRHNTPAWKTVVTSLPDEIFVSPKKNPFKKSRVGIFRFQEPQYAPGTGQAAAEALFGDLLKKSVFSFVCNEAPHDYLGMKYSLDRAREQNYDLIITGKVNYYFNGSDYMLSHVNEQITVVHVQTGKILWSAAAKNSAGPFAPIDLYLFQIKGSAARPAADLFQKNAIKFSNMLLRQPTQTDTGSKEFLFCTHEQELNDFQKKNDTLWEQNALLIQKLSTEVEKGIDLKKDVDELSVQADQLETQLQEEIKQGKITLKRHNTKTIINIDNSICFDSGSAVLKKEAKKSLSKISKTLYNFPDNNIQIEGHTDNVSIRSRKYPSNWELSSARAMAVLKYLLSKKEIAPDKLSAAGYGEYHPIAPNDSTKNKKLNRRVDIVIVPSKAQKLAKNS